MKHKLIQDIIHGNIELSDFEFLLLKDPIVNRLHQILQNSASYTVYPNMKSSRFEHSLGAMCYSGSMYRYGIMNSNISNEYLEDKIKWLKGRLNEINDDIFESFSGDGQHVIAYKSLLKNKFQINSLREIGEIFTKPEFESYAENFIGKSFVNRNLQFNKKRLNAINIILFQTVRLFGLLHDIGHLPLSHLFEFSIENLHEFLTDKFDEKSLEGVGSMHYHKQLKKLLGKSEDQIHEIIGKNITKYIFQGTIHKVSDERNILKTDIEKVVESIVVIAIREVWNELIKGKRGHFYSLYAIVSSTIDADRLDYVQRDGFLSGIAKYTGNVNRIIEMFCLGKNPNPDGEIIDNFLFMPSVQSLDSVEEILHHRFRIYRYVINHHAVLRSNYILQKIIESKLKREINSIDFKIDILEEEDLIPIKLLEVIDMAIKLSENEIKRGSSNEIISKYIQLTDFWLFSTLNKEFIETLRKSKEDYEMQDLLLREVYKSKRAFRSLWKREHEFHLFIRDTAIRFLDIFKLLDADIKDIICQKLNISEEYISQLIVTFEEFLKRERAIVILKQQILSPDVKGGTYHLLATTKHEKSNYEKELIKFGQKILGSISIFDEINGRKIMNKFERDFEKNNEFKVLISPTKIRSGVKDFYLIDRKNQEDIYPFERFSTKAESLKMSISDSIKFFVFFYDDGSINDKEVKDALIKLCLLELHNKLT